MDHPSSVASAWAVFSSTTTGGQRKSLDMQRPIQMLGFSLAAFLCVALAVLKLTSEVHWSWWRVLLPLWLVLGHNILYVTVGFVWIYLAAYGAK